MKAVEQMTAGELLAESAVRHGAIPVEVWAEITADEIKRDVMASMKQKASDPNTLNIDGLFAPKESFLGRKRLNA